jgi:hypothetical protein
MGMRISFVLCPSWGIDTPHLALALMTAVTRQEGHQVRIFDLNLLIQRQYIDKGLWKGEQEIVWEEPSFVATIVNQSSALFDSFVSDILASDPDVVGFSVYNTTYALSLELSRRIKVRSPDTTIVFGGQFCFLRQDAEFFLRSGDVDAVFMGEADISFRQFLRLCVSGDPRPPCAGFCTISRG